MSTARQAAERIITQFITVSPGETYASKTRRFEKIKIATCQAESVIQEAIDAATADITSERDEFVRELRDTAKSGLRLAKQLTRERDEAREALRTVVYSSPADLWQAVTSAVASYPWLKDSP